MSQIAWTVWNDEAVVYNIASGDTHHLNSVAALALQKLHTPHTAKSLASALSEELPIVLDQQFVLQIEQLLQQFDELGLITPT